LPSYLEALNSDFRYQLTSIGEPRPNLYVAEEISGNHFTIAGGRPGARVSWEVTGVRIDAYANAHRIKVEAGRYWRETGIADISAGPETVLPNLLCGRDPEHHIHGTSESMKSGRCTVPHFEMSLARWMITPGTCWPVRFST
jgi:hypothetical protein